MTVLPEPSHLPCEKVEVAQNVSIHKYDMSDCITCKETLGLKRSHTEEEGCPVRAAWFCDRCGNHGHQPSACDEINHVERPKFYEDLIPTDVLERWGIKTRTPLVLEKVTLEVAEREIANTNTIEIAYRDGKQDSRIREVMRNYKIPTVHKMDKNLLILRGWAVRRGKKIRLIQEKA